ncbi:glucokinase [Secundilactobacillus silagincola]|uniref:Glucokinase n=1 Tax=Secundilactobacillus silagincola TaxID=1714681 RepID=A0A1Z5J5F2_9LACO|nr:glucokinase [Secundilactobacillus silagincola]
MYIGIDLGGTNIKLGLLNDDLGVQKKLKVATQSETNSQTVMNNLISGIKQLLIKTQR